MDSMAQGAPSALSGDESRRILDILDYWRRIEFFIPFDLDNLVEDAESRRRKTFWLHAEALADAAAELWRARAAPGYEVGGYNLYLGVFDKREIVEICRHVIAAPSSDAERCEDDERGELEGSTCFAKIALGALGEPSFES